MPPPVLTTEQHRRMRHQLESEMAGRYDASNLVGAGSGFALAFAINAAFPHAPWWCRWGAPFGAAAVCLLSVGLVRIPLLARHIGMTSLAIGMALTLCIAAAASHTGGFQSLILATLFLPWTTAVMVFPLPANRFAAGALLEVALTTIVVYLLSPAPGSPFVYWLVTLGVGGMCVLGAVLRERTEVRLFLAQESLTQLNANLEKRVAEKVQERSRELNRALRLVAKLGTGELPSTGDELGGRVKLLRLLGQGGMGAVFLADDLLTGERVAVKVMRPGAMDADGVRRFFGEAASAAAVAATVAHPGVVKTRHIDVTAEGLLYLIMEYVEGATLDRLARGRTFSPGEAARLGAAAADALAAAHAAGVVHRDIKPSNLMACEGEPGVRILDFGLSKMYEPAELAYDATLTHSRQILGTPRYMSPEQAEDPSSVTKATDVYSLGLVLQELAPGDGEVGEVIAACLAPSPDRRPTAAELAQRLTAAADVLEAPSAPAIVRRLIRS